MNTETEAKPKRQVRKYVVVVDTNDGDTRIVLASHAYKFVSKNPERTLYSGDWIATARSDDLEQLRAMCRLVGLERRTDPSDDDDFLYSYWPGTRETDPLLPADERT